MILRNFEGLKIKLHRSTANLILYSLKKSLQKRHLESKLKKKSDGGFSDRAKNFQDDTLLQQCEFSNNYQLRNYGNSHYGITFNIQYDAKTA